MKFPIKLSYFIRVPVIRLELNYMDLTSATLCGQLDLLGKMSVALK